MYGRSRERHRPLFLARMNLLQPISMLPLRRAATFRPMATSHQLEDSTACRHGFPSIKPCRTACKIQCLVAPSLLKVKLSNSRVRQLVACSKSCAKEFCCLNPGPIQSRLSAAATPFFNTETSFRSVEGYTACSSSSPATNAPSSMLSR